MAEILSYNPIDRVKLFAKTTRLEAQKQKGLHSESSQNNLMKTLLIDASRMTETATPYSTQEYLGLTAIQAALAAKEGNYGVGAVYVFRNQGTEWLVLAKNRVITGLDSHAHAEQVAIDAVEAMGRGQKPNDVTIISRPAQHDKTERFIATSLEPCPMCTTRIATHNTNPTKIDTVLIATPDELGGQMLPERAGQLPPVWQMILTSQNISSIIPQSKDYDQAHFVHPDYVHLPGRIFFETREEIDNQLQNGRIDVQTDKALAEQLPLWTINQ